MRRLAEIERERSQTEVILGLTHAFEGIASMRISQVKDQTLMSGRFFGDLWQIYSQIRVDELFHFGRDMLSEKPSKKELLILITSEGSLSGDIDEQLIKEALKHYQPDKNDIIVIGGHGVQLLTQQGVSFIKSYRLPVKDYNINVGPLLSQVQKYESATVYWESYLSIMTQKPKTIRLADAVADRGQTIKKGEEVISEDNYIFEPSTFEVVSHLERTMLQIMLSELILESKLAQYASRFKAMSTARQRAQDSLTDVTWAYNLTKRRSKDERLKGIINGLRKPLQ